MTPASVRPRSWLPWTIASGLGLVLAWSYGSTLVTLVQRWSSDARASHGFIIPLIAGFLLWQWRESRPGWPERCNIWGLLILAAAAGARLLSVYLSFGWLDGLSLLVSLTGLVVLVGGWPALRWCWPALAYLLFLLPLPDMVETALSGPLQRLATLAGAYTLQTLGYPAIAQGNVILLENSRVDVVQACSGLGMLTTFFAISTAAALLVRRPLLDRLILVGSAIPIGIAVNLVRIAATAVAHQTLGPQQADRFFHDWAGWLMMPLAVAGLVLAQWLLGKLLLPAPVTVRAAPPLRPVAAPTSPAPTETLGEPVVALKH